MGGPYPECPADTTEATTFSNLHSLPLTCVAGNEVCVEDLRTTPGAPVMAECSDESLYTMRCDRFRSAWGSTFTVYTYMAMSGDTNPAPVDFYRDIPSGGPVGRGCRVRPQGLGGFELWLWVA